MNTKRLMKLIDFMDKLPQSARKHFYMGYWFGHSNDHDHGAWDYVTKHALMQCGTTACALGWAAVVPSLRKAGLRVPTQRSGPEPISIAKEFFGIDDDKAHALFNPGRYDPSPTPTTPKQWAKMARKLVNEWSAK